MAEQPIITANGGKIITKNGYVATTDWDGWAGTVVMDLYKDGSPYLTSTLARQTTPFRYQQGSWYLQLVYNGTTLYWKAWRNPIYRPTFVASLAAPNTLSPYGTYNVDSFVVAPATYTVTSITVSA